ncbi:MAG: hypothetical protein IJ733_10180 [Lachnospiraceae bacterium]|nr:hypothetical protein [Lachnospiraceae bacterium]
MPPANEKEYNGNLFDQLEIVERIEEVAQEEKAEKVLKACQREKEWINRKLYQKPPLTEDR